MDPVDAALFVGGPAAAGPPFRTDDPEPVETGHWEVYQFSAATHVAGDTSAANCSTRPPPRSRQGRHRLQHRRRLRHHRAYDLLFSAGRGVENAGSTNAFSYYLALQVTF